MKFLILATLVAVIAGEVYYQEKFHSGWEKNWVQSKHSSDYGKFVWATPKYYNDAEEDKGIKTSQDAHFYAFSSAFPKVSNTGKKFIVQFTVKHEQNIDCGGGYVKLFPSTADIANIHGGEGETPYNIMFGPDICGPGTRKVHVIFNYKGKNLECKKSISCLADEATHLYTLIVNPDNTYEVRIDDKKVESGNLYDDWAFLPAKTINDPKSSKPSDWVDEKTIADASDAKPEDWDKPQFVSDPDAKQPEDWDSEMDGEWEAPQISNPDYKGDWKAKQVDNPAYKGEWVHPQVDNPDYSYDDAVYDYEDFGIIGLDLWQVKAGTIFDNFLITDDLSVQAQWAQAFQTQHTGEEANKKKEEEATKASTDSASSSTTSEEDVDEELDDSHAKDEL